MIYDFLAFNLLTWSLDLVGDVLGLVVVHHNYVLFMVLGNSFAAGLSPLVYMIGSGDFFGEKLMMRGEQQSVEMENRKTVQKKKKTDDDKAGPSTVINIKNPAESTEPDKVLFTRRIIIG